MTPATPPPATRPHARLRAWLMRAGAVVLGLLAALAMLELGLRVTLLRYAERIDRFRAHFAHEWGGELSLVHFVRPSADTDRVYEMIPGAHGTFAGAPLRINPTGFRDADHPVEKPPGTRRVAVLGDSVAFGWGVPAEQRFSDVLAHLLNTDDAPTTPTTTDTDDTATTGGTHATAASAAAWQVLNFAVPGYNSTMELATLRAVVMAHAPDVVVVSVIANDDELPNFVRLEPEVWSLRRSFIAEAVRDRMVGRPIGDTARLAAGGVVEAGGAGHGRHVRGFRPELVPPEYRHLMGMDNARAALAGIARTCREAGIPVVALFFSPHLGGDDDAAPPRDLVPWIAAARDAGMTLCDPSPALRRYLRQHGLTTNALRSTPDDMHPNARAHAIIARTLRETLREPLREPLK